MVRRDRSDGAAVGPGVEDAVGVKQGARPVAEHREEGDQEVALQNDGIGRRLAEGEEDVVQRR